MSAMVKIHAHDGVAGLADSKLYCHICLCTGVGLNIGIIAAEQLLCPFNRQIFHDVHTLTAAVIPLSGIAFRIFIGKNTSHGSHDRLADPVFRCNQLNVAVLSFLLIYNSLCDFRVNSLYFL